MKLLTTITLLLSTFFCTAQNYQYAYNLDGSLSSTTPEKAVFIGKGFKENGTVKVDFFYHVGGKLFMSAHFTDSTISTMHGNFRSYYFNDQLESAGNYKNGLEDGYWLKWDSTGVLRDSTLYSNGRFLNKTSFLYDSVKRVTQIEYVDSTTKAYNLTGFESGKKSYEAFFIGQNGVLKKFENDSLISSRTVLLKDLQEAEYPGKAFGWSTFLRQNMKLDGPLKKKVPPGTYPVIIRFIVETDGSISNISPETNFGFGMEEEAIRVIKKSGKWIPASFFGTPVKAYRRQPVTFVFAEE